jgi:hypothetical protein
MEWVDQAQTQRLGRSRGAMTSHGRPPRGPSPLFISFMLIIDMSGAYGNLARLRSDDGGC